MSDCLINIRAWLYHFQLTRNFRIRISRNNAHPDLGAALVRGKVYQAMEA